VKQARHDLFHSSSLQVDASDHKKYLKDFMDILKHPVLKNDDEARKHSKLLKKVRDLKIQYYLRSCKTTFLIK